MLAAVIPAGGHSRRMGRPKLGLPLGEKTVLEWVIHAFRRVEAEPIVVVLAPHNAELIPIAQEAGASVVEMPHATPDMRSTVEAGLRWLEQRYQPDQEDWWLLAPADHPTLDAEVIRDLLEARNRHDICTIVLPTHERKRGHPALLAWEHVAGIRDFPEDQGINAYLRAHAKETLEVPVDSPRILDDLNKPEDYERLVRQWTT